MSEFRLTLLGSFAFSASSPCAVPSKKGQALLAFLAIPPGRAHRRDKLATMLWSGHTNESARQNLRQCLTALRKGCQNGEAVPVVAEGDMLRLDARVIVDVGEFEDAMRGRDPAALARARMLYRGELLEGLYLDEVLFDEWLIGERRRLNALAIDGLNQLLQHQQRQGEREAAMQTALRLLVIDPLQESVHRSLMRLYHEFGNAAQALRQYAACEKTLHSELNVEPEDATKELRREILRSRYVSSPKAESNPYPVQEDRLLLPNGTELQREANTPAAAPGDRPSIAVLPFANLCGDLEQDYFSDGMTEDIITELSRFSELFVIARNSSFVYKGKSVDVRQIGRELGVRYVLEGSVRKSGNRVRITGQLVDTTKGAHIWADRIDGALEDIFDLQDQMSAIIVAAIAPKLEHAEIERASRKPTKSLDAYEYYLRGMASFHQGSGKGFAEALDLFKKAIELDPGFASAYAMAAWCHYIPVPFWTVPEEVREAERLARLAARLGPNNAAALSVAGFVVASVAHDFGTGLALVDRALVLNPNLVNAWYLSGWVRVLNGEHEVALEHFSRAERLSPFDPFKWGCHLGVAYAHFMAGRDDQALSSVEHCLRDMPNFRPALLVVAASSAFLGATDRAKTTIARIRQLEPGRCISQLRERMPFRQSEQIARLLDGLRKAGCRSDRRRLVGAATGLVSLANDLLSTSSNVFTVRAASEAPL